MASRRLIALLAVVVGVVLIVAAVVYFAEPAKSLPGFMGHLPGATVHRTKRGVAALVLGIIMLICAWLLGRPARARAR